MGQLVELADSYGFEDTFPEGEDYTARDADALEMAAMEFLQSKGVRWQDAVN